MNAFSFPSHRNPLPIHPVCLLRSAETLDPQNSAPGLLHRAGLAIHGPGRQGARRAFLKPLKSGIWKDCGKHCLCKMARRGATGQAPSLRQLKSNTAPNHIKYVKQTHGRRRDIRSFLININTGDFSNGRNYRNKDASSGAVSLAGSPGPGPAGEGSSQPCIQKDFLAHWQMWTSE